MDGASRSLDVPPARGSAWPPAHVVHAIHDRYLLEIVEELGLCPFARRCRQLGRVHRPLFWADGRDPTPSAVAHSVETTVSRHTDAEIILVTFVDMEGRFSDPGDFDVFVTQTREAYDRTEAPTFFMVGFHPQLGQHIERETTRPLTRDSLVPLIRRTPDPVIQCVRASVLEQARRQAQVAARQRLLDSVADKDPVLRRLIEHSVQADSELSADIAQKNFTAIGQGDGRAEFERRIAAIQRARDRAYASESDHSLSSTPPSP